MSYGESWRRLLAMWNSTSRFRPLSVDRSSKAIPRQSNTRRSWVVWIASSDFIYQRPQRVGTTDRVLFVFVDGFLVSHQISVGS